ncbi:hypothetical protein FVA74_00545 [Salinibacterium sp. dk2585]|uniref:hypothetical protein n=1 Tax=unclassified Salinibacterium TaxID=2632331 RepID=UPI0011C255EC|nr:MULTISPECIES: hypothetical protein [unclassified Salinibacterium]QEE60215.1 hypothetical protein FVA74_00545 [Salinibacterium sp. dk2585]TXK55287.1 hypothetical protein FVP63_00690 [Salinibacterium sp. dk5596]
MNDGASPQQPDPASAGDFAFIAGRRNSAPLATAALAVALVIPVLRLVFSAVSASVLAARDFPMVSVVAVVEGIIVFLLAVAALVLGAVVLARRRNGRARAGAAIGIAAVALWNIVVGLINGALLEAFLG